MHSLDDIIQNLLSVDWPSEFNFLHIPKIEALAKDVAIRALAVAGGSEVAKSLGLSVSESATAASISDSEPVAQDTLVESTPDPILLSAEEIGFTHNQASLPKSPKIDFIDPDDEPETDPVPVAITPGVKGAHTPGVFKKTYVMPKMQLPKIHLPHLKFNLKNTKPLWWYLGGGIVAIGLLVFYFVWILPSATVTILVTPKTLEEDVELTLSSTETSIDFAGRVVPASIETVTETGEKSIETTGKKIIGEPAKGEVTIYNRTSATKALTKGTLLSANNLKFTLDDDVSVASKSAGSDYVDVPGKASIKISASSIGTDYNLPAGTEFTVASFGKDSYVAKNDGALAGGTSEEVQVVGKDDQKNLVNSLTQDLLSTLTSKAIGSGTPGSGVYLLPDSSQVDTVSYSAKVGETSKSLAVNLTIKASLLRYQTEDVTTLVNSSIDQAVPPGYIRANLPSTVDLTASTTGTIEDNVKGNAKVKVSLLPVIDQNSLSISLKGKSSSDISNLLMSSVPGFVTAEIITTPRWIPTRLKSVPLNPSHINIQIAPSL